VARSAQCASEAKEVRFRATGGGIAAADETDFHFRIFISDFRLDSVRERAPI